ncbi:hypothetical protein VP168E361_P0065 [Vibrio phage 168E36-1]|nr:hypothetical protein VP168E361_P0065 [Vibrio phage 168E36-1]
MKYIPLLFALIICVGLWLTRPASAMPTCLANNPAFSCQFLEKE